MRYIIILICLVFASSIQLFAEKENLLLENEISSPENFIQQPFDVISYNAELNFMKFPTREMIGICTIDVKCTGNPDTSKFFFHLRDLVVDSLFWGSEKAEYEIVGEETSASYHYSVAFPDGGDIPLLKIYYSGIMGCEKSNNFGGVFSSSNILYSIGVGFDNNYVSTTQHWLPCYDHPSDKALFSAKFLVPPNVYVASTGEFKQVTVYNDTAIYEWEHKYPCATYLYTFAVSTYMPMVFSDDEPPIIVYTKPEDTTRCKVAYKLLPQMVKCFEKRFGKYPFEKVGYANTIKGAMESQTLVSMPIELVKAYYLDKDTLAVTVAHELSHQWFGDMVTCFDFRDAWLNEGFATFCESVWKEDILGFNEYLKWQTTKINSYFINGSKDDGVISLYNFPREDVSNYPRTIYEKGAVVVGMLRYELGDEQFFGAINSYLQKYKYSNATTQLLKKELEGYTGKKLDWFFDQWIYGKGWPILYIDYSTIAYPDSNYTKVFIHIKQNQPKMYGSYTNVPVEFGFYDETLNYHYRLVNFTDIEQDFELDSVPYFTFINVNKGPTVRALLQVQSLTDIQENSNDNNDLLTVYPNPSDGVVEINYQNNDDIGYTALIKIFDIEGNILLTDDLVLDGNFVKKSINLGDFSSGTYILQLKVNNKNIIKKIKLVR